jgi:hypothetical protein
MTTSDVSSLPTPGVSPWNGDASSSVDFIAPTDVLLRDVHLAYETTHAILGLRTRVRSNSRGAIALFDETFTIDATAVRFSAGAHDELPDASRPPLSVQVVVYRDPAGTPDTRAVRHICPDAHRVIVHGANGFAISDPARHEAVIYASDALVRDAEHFRSAFLEATTLALATHFDRHPFHAAAVIIDGTLILLCGPSGAGKSTLAYQARELGGVVISEDTIRLQLEPTLTIWGRCEALHMLPGSGAHFPPLLEREAVLQPTGKTKISVPVQPRKPSGPTVASGPVLCLLGERRASERARLERLGPAEVLEALERNAAPGFDRYPERRARAARLLAASGGWRMHLTPNPHDALQLLTQLASGRTD